MKRIAGILILGALLGAGLAVPAHAQAADGVIQVAAKDQFISLDEAVARVRRQVDGEVISAKTRKENGRMIHLIKVYDRGRVRTFRVDAGSGRIR